MGVEEEFVQPHPYTNLGPITRSKIKTYTTLAQTTRLRKIYSSIDIFIMTKRK